MQKNLIIMLACIILVAGCLGNRQAQPTPDNSNMNVQQHKLTLNTDEQAQTNQQSKTVSLNLDGQSIKQISPSVRGGEEYYPLSSILEEIGYYVLQDEAKTVLKAGSTDVIYQVKEGDLAAQVEDNQVQLTSPIAKINNELCLTAPALQKILATSYAVDISEGNINITTKLEDLFEKNDDLRNISDLTGEKMSSLELEHEIATLSAAQADNLIRTARNFIGTPYVFGAPSGTTRIFDCSSFTEHVFAKYGINLPRVARAQARLGQKVPAANLRKGDLLFFNWPGRFRSNNIVGHVAIYIGNGHVIHTTPSEGVHIANVVDSEYWRTNYLGAKRILAQ